MFSVGRESGAFEKNGLKLYVKYKCLHSVVKVIK